MELRTQRPTDPINTGRRSEIRACGAVGSCGRRRPYEPPDGGPQVPHLAFAFPAVRDRPLCLPAGVTSSGGEFKQVSCPSADLRASPWVVPRFHNAVFDLAENPVGQFLGCAEDRRRTSSCL